MASLSFHLFPYQSVFRNDYYDLSQIKVKTGQNDSYKQFVMLQAIIPFSNVQQQTQLGTNILGNLLPFTNKRVPEKNPHPSYESKYCIDQVSITIIYFLAEILLE